MTCPERLYLTAWFFPLKVDEREEKSKLSRFQEVSSEYAILDLSISAPKHPEFVHAFSHVLTPTLNSMACMLLPGVHSQTFQNPLNFSRRKK